MSVITELGAAFAWMFIGLVLFVIGVHFVFFLRRCGWLPGGRPNHQGLASAYVRLQGIVQPDRLYVLEETEDEKRQRDDQGGPDDPTAHLRRHTVQGETPPSPAGGEPRGSE